MEERLDHVRTEVCYILFCSTIGRYIAGHTERNVTFSAINPMEFKTPADAQMARTSCLRIFRNNINRTMSGYRLSIRRWEYQWSPGGQTQLTETRVK